MFSALENTWDQSARRGWTTAVSFAMQALGVSLLLAIPLLTVQGPPQWMRMTSSFFAPPAGRSAPAPPSAQHPIHPSNVSGVHLLQPDEAPDHQAGSGEQDDADGYLCNHQRSA